MRLIGREGRRGRNRAIINPYHGRKAGREEEKREGKTTGPEAAGKDPGKDPGKEGRQRRAEAIGKCCAASRVTEGSMRGRLPGSTRTGPPAAAARRDHGTTGPGPADHGKTTPEGRQAGRKAAGTVKAAPNQHYMQLLRPEKLQEGTGSGRDQGRPGG